MSDTYNARVDLSEINGKPVDAIGNMLFQIDFDHFKPSPFCIEKIFGLVDVDTDAIFKFKLVVSEDGRKRFKFKLIYVSEQPIDCKIKIASFPSAILEHLTIGDEVETFACKKEDLKKVYFSIGVLVIKATSMSNDFARKFNDPSTSDFIVHCQGKQFYVHQDALKEKSKYFDAIFHNDCIEKREKMLTIDDFPPKVVEIFLRHFYNGAFPVSRSVTLDDMIHLMTIADKYNATELFDAIESYASQEFFYVLTMHANDEKPTGSVSKNENRTNFKILKRYMEKLEKVQAPKFTSMIYEWRRTKEGSHNLDNKQWSSLIWENPNFAMLGGLTVGRSDYQNWVKQHISWILTCEMSTRKNDFAVLVGTIGEMKGAVKCSLF